MRKDWQALNVMIWKTVIRGANAVTADNLDYENSGTADKMLTA